MNEPYGCADMHGCGCVASANGYIAIFCAQHRDLDDFAKDIAAKAYWAIVHNDGWPKPAWSTGERLAVALVLDYTGGLEAEDYTRDQALSRLAGDIGGGAADAETWVKKVRERVGLTDGRL